MKGNMNVTCSLGQGVIDSSSTKQKVNSRISTKAEPISIDKKIRKIV